MSEYGVFSGQYFPVCGPEKKKLDFFHAMPEFEKGRKTFPWSTDMATKYW